MINSIIDLGLKMLRNEKEEVNYLTEKFREGFTHEMTWTGSPGTQRREGIIDNRKGAISEIGGKYLSFLDLHNDQMSGKINVYFFLSIDLSPR